MRVRVLLVSVFFVLLGGCDSMSGTSFRNSVGSDIEVTVTFEDGKTFTHVYAHCQGFFLGQINGPPIKAVRMVIKKDGKVIHDLDAAQLDYFWEFSEGLGRIETDQIWWETDPREGRERGCVNGEPIKK